MKKLILKYPVVVEGKYDKIKLSSIISSPVIVLNGFSFFNDREKQQLIRKYTKNGAIILTDSDKAGTFIRAKLKGYTKGRLINLYTPSIEGKEKRKTSPSKDGLLGVEGIDADILRKILLPYEAEAAEAAYLTKQKLYADGLSGGSNSADLRRMLLKELELPESLSSGALCDAVNSMIPKERYEEALKTIKSSAKEG